MPSPVPNRVFNPHGRRHYRRRYSLTEVRIGALVLLALGVVAGWVAYMGAHPDPELFQTEHLLDPGAPIEAAGASDREPFPRDLAPQGFAEGPVRHYTAGNLYEKINGRADYFLSRGFLRLSSVSLQSSADQTQTLDLELYDLASPDNALSAYAGEKPPELSSEPVAAGLLHRDRNALYLTHGRFYLRAIGSAESEAVSKALEHVREALQRALPAPVGPVSYAQEVFTALELPAGSVRFERENAFSFGFAREVHVATLAAEAGELFLTRAPDAAAAEAVVAQFVEGFASYGEALEPGWVKDRYLGTLAAVASHGPIVYGVRGLADRAQAERELARLRDAVKALPPDALQRPSSAGEDSAAQPAPHAPPAKLPLAEAEPASDGYQVEAHGQEPAQ